MQSLNYPPGHPNRHSSSSIGSSVRRMGFPKASSNFSFCILATLIFACGCFLFLMSRDLSRADELIGHAHATLVKGSAHIRAEYSTMFNPRTIEIYNAFEHDISAYYEDGMSGSFLANIAPNDLLKVSASTGFTIFATELMGMHQIAHIVVQKDQNRYNLKPLDYEWQHPGGVGGSDPLLRSQTHVSVRTQQRPHPAVTSLLPQPSAAMPVKFKNLLPTRVVDLWYHPGSVATSSSNGVATKGSQGVLQATLAFGESVGLTAYHGNSFYFTYHNNGDKTIHTVTIGAEKCLYSVREGDVKGNNNGNNGNNGNDGNNGGDGKAKAVLDAADKEEAFLAGYYKQHGTHWYQYYGPQLVGAGRGSRGAVGPRPAPALFMWPANLVGEVHSVTSGEGYWTCDGAVRECQSGDPVALQLEVLSTKPKVYIIEDFLSSYECENIIQVAEPRMRGSTVGEAQGAHTVSTRTSSNAWLARHTSPVTESVFKRVAHVLNIDETLLHHDKSAEDLQVLHYGMHQKYEAHYDWAGTTPQSRYVTLLLYLSDQVDTAAGGETAFPRAQGRKGQPFKVHPKKGTAVLLYNMLADGNGDADALHAAMSVIKGGKYLANVWVWDPARPA